MTKFETLLMMSYSSLLCDRDSNRFDYRTYWSGFPYKTSAKDIIEFKISQVVTNNSDNPVQTKLFMRNLSNKDSTFVEMCMVPFDDIEYVVPVFAACIEAAFRASGVDEHR